MTGRLLTVDVRNEHDVVLARQRARQIAGLLGLDRQDQARVATAVSELARNAYEYARGGRVEYLLADRGPELVVRVVDEGPGIADLDAVLSGTYHSKTGMGLGLAGAHRLMDRVEVETAPGRGTVVVAAKRTPPLPGAAREEAARIGRLLAHETVAGPLGEMQLQNQELIRTLGELQERQDELAQLNRELEETNRGVVALYAELEERANVQRRSSEAKSRFLTGVSHELRTPLSSILALCELLLNRVDGPLTEEQERQVRYINSGAASLLGLVNDLLDLERIEAGVTAVQPAWFAVEDLFGSLRGMLRPLLRAPSVELVFEPAGHLPEMRSDESKLAQILRNLVANALKFTESGEVRISARVDERAETIAFAVSDTGIGIPPEARERIFDEFVQLEGPLQRANEGSGLGLAVSRRLATVLGGRVVVESDVGAGSTFTVVLPLELGEAHEAATEDEPPRSAPSNGRIALVIDDDTISRYVAERALRSLGYTVAEAADGRAGLEAARERRPDLIVLDLGLPDVDGFAVLDALAADESTAAIPVVVLTARRLTPEDRGRLARAIAVVDKRDVGSDALAAVIEPVATVGR